jgi:Fe-S-cluster-containing hydrogenase component 2
VTIIDERCIICGYCRDACPHEAISYHQERAVYLKCDLCRARVNGPVCVEVCPTGALSLTSAIREDEKL